MCLQGDTIVIIISTPVSLILTIAATLTSSPNLSWPYSIGKAPDATIWGSLVAVESRNKTIQVLVMDDDIAHASVDPTTTTTTTTTSKAMIMALQ